MSVKLLNQSQRIIQLSTGVKDPATGEIDPTKYVEFGPKQVVSVNKDTAEKLLGMYHGEVVDLAQHTKDLSDQAKALGDQKPEDAFTEIKLNQETDSAKKDK